MTDIDVFTGETALHSTGELFISVDDFAEWMQMGGADADWRNRAETALQIATGYIRAQTGRYLTRVTGDIVTIDGPGGTRFRLPEWPVTGVTEIREAGDLVTTDSYEWATDGRVWRTSGCWSWHLRGITATYTHGYDPVPADLLGLCQSLAARTLNSPDGQAVQQLTLGRFSETYARLEQGGVSQIESSIIARYKRVD